MILQEKIYMNFFFFTGACKALHPQSLDFGCNVRLLHTLPPAFCSYLCRAFSLRAEERVHLHSIENYKSVCRGSGR